VHPEPGRLRGVLAASGPDGEILFLSHPRILPDTPCVMIRT
jgi:hypothetical protein